MRLFELRREVDETGVSGTGKNGCLCYSKLPFR